MFPRVRDRLRESRRQNNGKYADDLRTLIQEDCINGLHRDEYTLVVGTVEWENSQQQHCDRSVTMEQRQIAYYYNGIIKSEETDLDLGGDMTIPTEGEVVIRPGGKQWRVVKVSTRHDAGNALPVYMVYLTAAQPN